MPAQAQTLNINLQQMFPQFSLPALKNYIVFSAILFFSGFYYYFRIVHQLLNKPLDEPANGEELDEPTEKDKMLKDVVGIVRKHRLLFYILLNTCCAMVALMGKTLSGFFFGQLTNQEESFAKKYFRRYVQTKLTFLIFISHHNLLEDILMWTPWLAIQIVCLLLLELASLRMANAYNVISNSSIQRRLFASLSTTGFSALLMILFVATVRGYINTNYCLFLATDCAIILLQSIHLLCKLFTLHEATVQGAGGQQRPGAAYHLDLTYGLLRDCLEFANYLHMIFYSQLAITYCCVFLCIQAQHYYGRISTKIRKHWQQRKIINHIKASYVEASEAELLKCEQCLICWQPMKTARKLPCAHIFHEHCLRRWLEQDSSCAVCRQALAVTGGVGNAQAAATRQQQQQAAMVEEEISLNQAMQMLMDIFSPQNNRIARWWSRLVFESLNEEQVTTMVNQVAEMFPQVSTDLIRQLVQTTGSVTVTVETLLQNGGNNPQGIGANPAQADDPLNTDVDEDESSSSSSSSEESYNESSDNEDHHQHAHNQQQNTNAATTASSSQSNPTISSPLLSMVPKNPLIRTKNDWLNQQMEMMLAHNRSKYLQSVNRGGASPTQH